MFGKVENPKNERLLDLSLREFATFAPLIVLAVWIGLYPAPFLRRLETSVQRIVVRVDPQYAGDAPHCDTPVTPELRPRPTPAGQFLAAPPCGPTAAAPRTARPTPSTGRRRRGAALMPPGVSRQRLLLHPAGAGADARRRCSC